MDIQLQKHNEKVPDSIMEHIRRVLAKNLTELNAELAPLGFAAIEVFQSKDPWVGDTTPYPTPGHYMEIFEIHDYVDRMVGIALEKPDDSSDLVTKLRGLRETLKSWARTKKSSVMHFLPHAGNASQAMPASSTISLSRASWTRLKSSASSRYSSAVSTA